MEISEQGETPVFGDPICSPCPPPGHRASSAPDDQKSAGEIEKRRKNPHPLTAPLFPCRKNLRTPLTAKAPASGMPLLARACGTGRAGLADRPCCRAKNSLKCGQGRPADRPISRGSMPLPAPCASQRPGRVSLQAGVTGLPALPRPRAGVSCTLARSASPSSMTLLGRCGRFSLGRLPAILSSIIRLSRLRYSS